MNIIITGASRGIGFELVKALAKQKQNQIVAISRNGKALSELVEICNCNSPGAKVIPYEFDLNRFDLYPVIAQRLQTVIPTCDVLVNNAGKLVNKPFGNFGTEEFDDTFNVNVKGPFFFIQALVPLMSKGSHIVNIGSMGGVQGSQKFPGLAAYSASKGALAILTEVLAEELATLEIKVNCLAIGAVQTEMFTEAFPGAKALQNPEQMALFMADFAMNGHQYFNGKVVPVSLSVP